jgi:hypothetical protein
MEDIVAAAVDLLCHTLLENGPMSRRRVFLNSDRAAFARAIKQLRMECVNVSAKAPIGGIDYRTAGALVAPLDDAIGALTGDREAMWNDPAGGPPRPRPDVLPIGE